MRRNSMSGNLALSSEVMADDFQMKLNYLENRVAFARLLLPSDARVAMDIADADATNFYTGLSASKSKGSSGNLKELRRVDAASLIAQKYLISFWIVIGPMPSSWKRVLLKSRNSKGRGSWKLKEDVQKAFYKYMAEKNRSEETGRRFFPHCSEVVDKLLDCDWPDASLLEFGAPEEQKLKRDRFTELKEDVQKAFCKDMAYDNLSGLPPSSSAFNKYMAEHNRSGMPTSSASSN